MRKGSNSVKKLGRINGVRSMAVIRPNVIRPKETQRLENARLNFENEFKEEQEEVAKVLNSDTCLTKRIENLFTLPYEKAATTSRLEKTGKVVKLKKVGFNSSHLNNIGVLFKYHYRTKQILS